MQQPDDYVQRAEAAVRAGVEAYVERLRAALDLAPETHKPKLGALIADGQKIAREFRFVDRAELPPEDEEAIEPPDPEPAGPDMAGDVYDYATDDFNFDAAREIRFFGR